MNTPGNRARRGGGRVQPARGGNGGFCRKAVNVFLTGKGGGALESLALIQQLEFSTCGRRSEAFLGEMGRLLGGADPVSWA